MQSAQPPVFAPRIYVGGSLFSFGQRFEQQTLATLLEQNGYRTYLPQRDGLELDNLIASLLGLGLTEAEAAVAAQLEIFNYDVFQLFSCNAMLSNGNGDQPDSGTVSETALAFAMGKPIVIFKDDIRIFALDTSLNPLYGELAIVPVVTILAAVPAAMGQALYQGAGQQLDLRALSTRLQQAIYAGSQIVLPKSPLAPTAPAIFQTMKQSICNGNGIIVPANPLLPSVSPSASSNASSSKLSSNSARQLLSLASTKIIAANRQALGSQSTVLTRQQGIRGGYVRMRR